MSAPEVLVEAPGHTVTLNSTGPASRRVYLLLCSCGEYRSPGWLSKLDARTAAEAHLVRAGARKSAWQLLLEELDNERTDA